MKDEAHICLAEIQSILDEFLAVGLVRRTVKRRDGQMVMNWCPKLSNPSRPESMQHTCTGSMETLRSTELRILADNNGCGLHVCTH